MSDSKDVEAIFAAARAIATPEARAAYLTEACGDDSSLRSRVEALLKADNDAGSFLEKPPVELELAATLADDAGDGQQLEREPAAPDPTSVETAASDAVDLSFLERCNKPGTLGVLGPYEVTEVIGRGGMGVVLKGLDARLNRILAIKVLAPEFAANSMGRQRFLREGRAAAAISHDHVVTIHGIDESGPLPYLTMEYIEGLSLQERIDRDGPLELKEILRVGKQTALGLAAAHAEGLIHRDIKPANILLENGIERVKITDFGLARAIDDVSITQAGVVTGTPQYMSPEQAQNEPLDPRSDLFSLGSLLYAMCTCRPPFRGTSTVAVIRRVCDDTPRPIREVNPEVPDWLVAIIDRLLAKDPDERFQSASEVARLLEAHLARVQHPLPAQGIETDLASQRTPSESPAAGATPSRSRSLTAVLAVLVLIVSGFGLSEATGLTQVVHTVMEVWTPHGTLVVEVADPSLSVIVDHDGEEITVSDGAHHILTVRPGRVEVRAEKEGKPVDRQLVTITRGGRKVVRIRIRPESDRSGATVADATGQAVEKPAPAAEEAAESITLANVDKVGLLSETAYDATYIKPGPAPDELLIIGDEQNVIVDETTLKVLNNFELERGSKYAFSRDQNLTGWLKGKKLFVRNEETGKTIEMDAGAGPHGTAFSPDNKVVAIGNMVIRGSEGIGHNELRIFRTGTGELINKLDINRKGYGALTLRFSPDGGTLAVGNRNYQTRLIDTATWTVKHTLPKAMTHGIEFSPDGTRLAAAYVDGSLIIWDVESGRNVKTIETGCAQIYSVSWNSTGDLLATCGSGGRRSGPDNTGRSIPARVQLWNAKTFELARDLMEVRWSHSVRFSSDSTRLLAVVTKLRTLDDRSRIAVWSVDAPPARDTTPTRIDAPELPVAGSLNLPAPASAIVVSPDGTQVIARIGRSERIGRWNFASGERTLKFNGKHDRRLWSVAVNPDGSTVATVSQDETGKLWDAKTGDLIATLKGHHGGVRYVAYSRSGEYVLTAGGLLFPYQKDDVVRVRIWNGRTGEFISEFRNHIGTVGMARFNADETLVLTGSTDHTARLWEVQTGKEVHAFDFGSGTTSIEFSADGDTILTACSGWASHHLPALRHTDPDPEPFVALWDASTGRQLMKLPHVQRVIACFDESEGQIVTASRGVITCFDTASGGKLKTLRSPLFDTEVIFGPSGKFFVVQEPDEELELWNIAAQKAVGRIPVENPYRWFFSPDGSTFYTQTDAGEFRSWSMHDLPLPSQKPESVDQAQPINLANVSSVALLSETPGGVDYIKSGPSPNELLFIGDERNVIVDETSLKAVNSVEVERGSSYAFNHDRTLTCWADDSKLFVRNEETGKIIELEAGAGPSGVAFLPATTLVAVGRNVVLGSEGQGYSQLRIIDAATGELLKRMELSREGYGAMTLRFSPDGRTLAVGNRNLETQLIDTFTWTVKHVLPKRMTHGIEFSPDGKQLAAACVDGSLAIWDVESGENVKTIETACAEIYSVSWNSSGDLLATSGTAGTRFGADKQYHTKPGYVQLWDTKTFKLVKNLMRVRWSHSVRFSSDSRRLLAVVRKRRTLDDRLRLAVWSTDAPPLTDTTPAKVNVPQLRVARSLDLPDVAAPTVALGPNGTQVIAPLRREYKLAKWDFASGERTLECDGKHSRQIWRVASNPDGSTIASASLDKSGKMWNAKTGELIATLEGHNDRVKYVTYSRSGRFVLTATGLQFPYEEDEIVTARIWDGKTGEFVSEFREHVGSIRMTRFNADETQVLTGSDDHTARLWDVKTGEETHVFDLGSGTTSIEFSPDGSTILTACSGRASSYLSAIDSPKQAPEAGVALWDATSGQQLLRLPHLQSVTASFNESGDRIVTACRGLITYFDTASGEEIGTLRSPLIGTSVTFSPNGKFFVVHEPGEELELWNITTQKPVGRMAIEKPYVKFFSPNDGTFYALTKTGDFRSWSTEGLN